MYYLEPMCLNIFVLSIMTDFFVSMVIEQHTLHDFILFLHLSRFALWCRIWSILVHVSYMFNCSLLYNHWRRKRQPTPVFMPGKSHGPRSLVGYNPWGCKESDMTERLLCVCMCVVYVL